MNTDTVIDREVDWLSSTTDTLPVLLKTASTDLDAPFDFIQAYWPSNTTNNRGMYVMRSGIAPWEIDQGHLLPRHTMRLVIWWSIYGDLQQAQRDLDVAVEAVICRVVGFPHEKTHGGRFLSAGVADRPGAQVLSVTYSPAERAEGQLRADITYTIDDLEVIA